MSPSANHDSADAGGKQQLGSLDLLERIKTGSLDPECISKDDRLLVVRFLIGEGYSTAEMAKVLRVSERTVERDRKELREGNAIQHDPRLVGQFAGQLVLEAEQSTQQIRKAIRGPNVPPAVKVDGYHRCFQIINELCQSLQRMSYLPAAAQKVQAELIHHAGELPTLDEIEAEARRLELINGNADSPADGVVKQLHELQRKIQQTRLAGEVLEISSELDTQGKTNDTQG